MLTEKANAICLLEVLKEYSDAEHILPMREIIAKMQSLYGIKIDRRTVYGAVALLIELGYDISLYEDNGVIDAEFKEVDQSEEAENQADTPANEEITDQEEINAPGGNTEATDSTDDNGDYEYEDPEEGMQE